MIIEAYWRAAVIFHVVDGDTLTAIVDMGHRVRSEQRLRLLGVNTPELHAPDPAVRQKAQDAKHYVEQWLADHGAHNTQTLTWGGVEAPVFNIRSEKGDVFGRWLAAVVCQDGHSLNDDLLTAGLAVPFRG